MKKFIPTYKTKYQKEVIPALTKEFGYTSVMQVPNITKIVINQGVGRHSVADKKIIDTSIAELSAIAGQKAVATTSRKDISNFKLRRGVAVGVCVTLRGERMYEFLERLIAVSLPRIRDFKGVSGKLDGRGNYSMGVSEQIIFPEIDIDKVTKMIGLQITFVTSANTDEEAYSLLREYGIPFKKR